MQGKRGEQVALMFLGSCPELSSKLPIGLAKNGLNFPRPCQKEHLFLLFSGLVPPKKSHGSQQVFINLVGKKLYPVAHTCIFWVTHPLLLDLSST